MLRTDFAAIGVVLTLGVLAVGCTSTTESEKATAQAKAEQLVSAARKSGVAPRLDVDTAKALYGADAPAVCKAFRGGLSSAESLVLLGNPSGRRSKTITTNAVEYGRLVIKTYCPDHLSEYDKVVKELDPIKTTR